MQSTLSAKMVLFLAGTIAAVMVLSYLIDDNLGLAWPTNVMRNWQEFGLTTLHGKLIYNPGGFEATTHPQSYNGMSPFCLYPAYFATEIFGWTGLDTLSFHILLLLAVLWGSWKLLGRDDFALVVAVVAVLCPGYLRWSKILDPNALSVLPVLPYAAIVLQILKKPKLTPALMVALLLLTLAFMSLNWTTGWVCAPCIFLLFGMRSVNRGGLLLLAALMFIGIPAIVVVSMAAKTGGPAAQSGHILGGYTWANAGYGEGLTTARAFIRLGFVNGIGLFPLWIAFIYAMTRRIRKGWPFSWIMFAPLAFTMADVIIMRNYFGHHPWMAGPVLLIGIIFSMSLLRITPAESAGPEKIPFKFIVALALLCFAYGFGVLAFFRTNQMDMLALTQLVRLNTPRSETIVIVKSADAATASISERLDEPLDRHVVVVNDFRELPQEKAGWVILSAQKLDHSFKLLARSTTDSQSWLNRVADWFNRSISRRSPGDRLDLSKNYFLYTAGP